MIPPEELDKLEAALKVRDAAAEALEAAGRDLVELCCNAEYVLPELRKAFRDQMKKDPQGTITNLVGLARRTVKNHRALGE